MEISTQITAPNSMIRRCAPVSYARLSKGGLSMAAFEGSWTMLFRHPASFTPICKTEFIELARLKIEFNASGVEFLGLSVDSVCSHLNWLEWIKACKDV